MQWSENNKGYSIVNVTNWPVILLHFFHYTFPFYFSRLTASPSKTIQLDLFGVSNSHVKTDLIFKAIWRITATSNTTIQPADVAAIKEDATIRFWKLTQIPVTILSYKKYWKTVATIWGWLDRCQCNIWNQKVRKVEKGSRRECSESQVTLLNVSLF